MASIEEELDAALLAVAILKAENARYREALQAYADLSDGDWYGPDDRYYNIGDTAREALKGRE